MRRMKSSKVSFVLFILSLGLLSLSFAQNSSGNSVSSSPTPLAGNALQMKLMEGKTFPLESDKINARALEKRTPLAPLAPVNVVHGLDSSFIVFGYQQSDAGYDYHYIWPGLTHVGASFVYFHEQGNIPSPSAWTGRPSTLKSGGAAQANGTKVIMVITNMYHLDSATNVEYSVFTNATYRQALVNNVVSLVTADTYCQGVSFDFEPWISSTLVRNGITAFTQSLSTTLKAINPSYELSYYINSQYVSSQIDIPNIMPYLDYVLYSCYDWSIGASTPNAVSDAGNYVGYVNGFLNAGIPVNKMVLAISAYGHEWFVSSTTNYDTAPITSSIGNNGFQGATYDVTNQPSFGGPYKENYHRGDETGWYGYIDGTGSRIHVIDDVEAMEYKTRMVKSWKDSGDVNNGKKLRGVGFWSLLWTATGSSVDPISHSTTAKTRIYPQLFQIYDEIFSRPGNHTYLVEKFEGPDSQHDFRWRSPSESPDTKGISAAAWTLAASPAGTGKPSYSDNAAQVTFTFASTSGNKLFFRHEVLNDYNDPTTVDTNMAKFYVNRNTKIRAYIYAAGNYTGRQVRMVVMDTTRQLEMSNPVSIAASGWQTMDWDLTDPTQISAYTTAEPALKNGNGVLDSSTTGDKDIGFIGFIVEGGSSGSGTLYFDEISYTPTNPSGKNYVINEFRYTDTSKQFVEIYGPAGSLPTGLQLRCYNPTDGSVTTAINLSGSIVDAGGGYGYFVAGNSGVPNVNQVIASGSIPNTQPGSIQLYNTANGNVYDSVVYQAWGGMGDLVRKQTHGVTQNGYPWIGEVASGTNSAGTPYTLGRYPDGTNTMVNGNDFSFMPASPGTANGGSTLVGSTLDFSTAPANAYQTYQAFAVADPVAAGIGASPNGGNAYRCIDVSGGGVEGFIGDASLGYGNSPFNISGYIYIPSSSADTDAIGIGIGGRQGSNFFTSTKATMDKTGYESGYWLIYENRSGVGLNDGLADHPNTFNFVYAHNDNMDTTKVTLLAAVTLSSTGATAGGWTPFSLSINPGTNLLQASINNALVYNGSIPSGGPTSGAFQIGFRENHAGGPTAKEGTWIDGLYISSSVANLSISPTVMVFTTYLSGPNPPTQLLTINNIGSPSFSWSAASSQTWLYANPASGSVSAGGSQIIQVGATLGALAAGNYSGQLTITAVGAANSPQSVAVTFVVLSHPTDVPKNWQLFE